MPNKVDLSIAQIATLQYFIPSIIAYNRLEVRPRTVDFDRSMKAEIRDPLWMLTRQWQLGEFQGEDAASPSGAQILYDHQPIDRVALKGGAPFSYDADAIPLETLVEREKFPFTVKEDGDLLFSDLLSGIRMSRFFIKSTPAGLQKYKPEYFKAYPFHIADKDNEAALLSNAVVETAFDGYALFRSILDARHDNWVDNNPLIDPGDRADLKNVASAFKVYYTKKHTRQYSQSETPKDSAWAPIQLEYQFEVAAAPSAKQNQLVFTADKYHQGHLDWYSFDAASNQRMILPTDPDAPVFIDNEKLESFIPAPIRFKGMAHPRYWQMEENQIDFGKIDTSTTGLLHLLLAEFGLIYSNDWFMLPHPMPINQVCEVKGILVTDVFGEDTIVRPAGKGPESAWQRWAFFHHAEKDRVWADRSLFYLTPAVGKSLKSDPLEKVNFMRDEWVSMAWGIENTIPSQIGKGIGGAEIAALEDGVPAPFVPFNEEVKIRYILGTRAPSNWTPFIGVHIDDNNTEIQLQRARMAGADPAKGVLLTEIPPPYFINEEEVPRAGAIVGRYFKRSRWLGGKTFLWVGREKQAGRGEGWSGLAFDQIEDINDKKT